MPSLQRIIVIDSGLGGLDVAARLEARCRGGLDLTYVNCRPTAEGGFNLLPGPAAQAACFARVLAAIRDRLAPDRLVIACNTLSVLLPETGFAATPACPIHEILELGAQAIHRQWSRQREADILILGTRITTASDEHRRRLIRLGVPPRAIHALPCHGLATLIEAAEPPDACRQALDAFSRAAASLLPPAATPLLLALCCTHYGCIADELRHSFSAALARPLTLVDPNAALADAIPCPAPDCPNQVRVLSRIPLPAAGVARFAPLIAANSPRLAAALATAQVIPDLF